MTGIIVQARMGSTRLPGKSLKQIGSKSLLQHVVDRVRRLHHHVTFVIATTTLPNDDVIEAFCAKQHIECFRGSSANVLERYYLCAQQYRMTSIVRLTADNPFTDIEELDHLIDLFDRTKADFCHSYNTLPIGVGAEIFTFAALETSYRKAKEPHHIEHVDEYLLEHPELFKTLELSVPAAKIHPDVRLTVDTEADYKRACYIAEHAATPFVTTEEAIRLCSAFA